MQHYLSHWSAISSYQSFYVESMFLNEINAEPQKHYTAFSEEELYPKLGRHVHLCSVKIPASLKEGEKGSGRVSLEFAFLQVAKDLPIHKLILLGLLLCGLQKGGRAPLTSKSKMMRRIQSVPYHAGKRKALRALQYVEDTCRSPMEALLYMFLTLPYSLGGYALRGAIFNYELILSPENAKIMKKNRVFFDLFYALIRLVIEYDSKEFHTDPVDLEKDNRRTACIINQNFTVFHIRISQLKDIDQLRVFAQNVAHHLGKRIRIHKQEAFMQQHRELRSLLPGLKNLPKPEKKWY